MKRWRKLLLLGLLPLLAGCSSFEYVGQKFEPTAKSEEITLYKSRAELPPPGTLRIIGRGTLLVPEKTAKYDIYELLKEEAREYGADAVCVVTAENVRFGTHSFMSGEVTHPGTFQRTSFHSPMPDDRFGSEVKLNREVRTTAALKVKALFLKKSEDVARELDARGRMAEDILDTPVAIPQPEKEEKPEAPAEVRLQEKAPAAEETVPAVTPAAG